MKGQTNDFFFCVFSCVVLSVYRRVCLVYDAPIKIFAVLCSILQGGHVKEAPLKIILLHFYCIEHKEMSEKRLSDVSLDFFVCCLSPGSRTVTVTLGH